MAESVNEKLAKLMKQKEKIENEIKELMDVLESQGGVGMHGSLVDEEQFPRNDIDVYTVRHVRQKVICLQNDHKALMKQIEENLYELHAEARQQKEAQGLSPTETSNRSSATPGKPFAVVNVVDETSPSHIAGLKKGDEIFQFGSVTSSNFESMATIATVVQHSKAKPLIVKVLRDGKEVRLSLTPNTWKGKGLLGCNIAPLTK